MSQVHLRFLQMSYSLNSFKGGLYRGHIMKVIKGHTRSVDYGSNAE